MMLSLARACETAQEPRKQAGTGALALQFAILQESHPGPEGRELWNWHVKNRVYIALGGMCICPALRRYLCRAAHFNRSAVMEITADQLGQLVEIIRPDFRTAREIMRMPESEAEFIAAVLGDEYGVTGVTQPPSYDFVVREYLPSEWRARLGVPTMESGSGEVTRIPPFQARVLRDLDTLRSSPLAALVYIIARAAGQDNETAMSYARLAQSVAAMLIMGRRPLRGAHGRSLSSTSLTPRDAPTWRVRPAMPLPRGHVWAQQQLYQQDLVQRGYSEPPTAASRSRPRPVPHLRR